MGFSDMKSRTRSRWRLWLIISPIDIKDAAGDAVESCIFWKETESRQCPELESKWEPGLKSKAEIISRSWFDRVDRSYAATKITNLKQLPVGRQQLLTGKASGINTGRFSSAKSRELLTRAAAPAIAKTIYNTD
ncbi:hypothetical protein EVAR_49165_1 [Eumeta japonica]|uniref:Uncharacterized protein n=1 Tax=Eumeta variegata TaxID=151549 RepID=A0A4C1YN59_EUMVA|nr:hypothetical protein EVAR_49165_1 [Eumeta japonica]